MLHTGQLDLVSLGEPLVELYRRADGAFIDGVAGDMFNTLFYASRLGLATGMITAVGNDLFTPSLMGAFRKAGIDASHVLRLDDRRNGLYFIELDDTGEYTFHFWRAGSAATQTLHGHGIETIESYALRARYFLLSGITLAVMEQRVRLFELLERLHGRVTIVLDTNYRQRLWESAAAYRACLERALPFVDLFLPSASDLRAAYADAPLDTLVREPAFSSPKLTVVKDGAAGYAIVREGGVVRRPPQRAVRPVDATGAGDAFNAGVIAGLSRGMSAEASADLGGRIALRALAVRGAVDWDFHGEAADANGNDAAISNASSHEPTP